MRHGKLVAFCAVAITAGVAFVAFRRVADPRGERAPARQAASVTGDSEAQARELRSLRSTVAMLGERLRKLENAPVTSETAAAAGIADESAADEANPSAEQVKEAKARFLEQLRGVDRAFETEQRDAAWAQTTERRLSDLLAQETFGRPRTVSSVCRSSMCRVEVVHTDPKSATAFELIRREMPGNFHLQRIEPDDPGGNGLLKTVAYFVRPGHEEENGLYDVMYRKR